MKFKKPTKKGAANTATMVAGATVGAMVSDAVAALIPTSNPTYKQLAVMGLGVAGMLTVTGTDTASEGVKGLFAGMAIQQGVKVTREGLVKVLPASATTNSFVSDALALNEAPVPVKSADKFLGVPIRNQSGTYGMQSLGNPDFSQPQAVRITASSLIG